MIAGASYSTKVKRRPIALQVGSITRYLTPEDARVLRSELHKAIATAEAFNAPRLPRLARLVALFKSHNQKGSQ